MRALITLAFCAVLTSACSSNPINAVPVSEFEADRYLGKWFEVARLDHSFERGLSNVTATYTKRDDGGIKVVNRGCKAQKAEWDDAVGRAYFTAGETTGQLKVSFFGPFYGKYIVFDLDRKNYNFAYVSGGSEKYLWLLSRTPEISKQRREDFIEKAKALGYNTDSLIWVQHKKICAQK